MNPGNTGPWPTAPHGVLLFAVLAAGLVLVIHFLGFRAMTSVSVGGA